MVLMDDGGRFWGNVRVVLLGQVWGNPVMGS